MADLVIEAWTLAERELSDTLPRRWRHSQAVAAKARNAAQQLLKEDDQEIVVAAAIMHDIGYAPELAVTGFHPLDGARWLRNMKFNERVTCLVAHHSCAMIEADERGLATELNGEFVHEASLVSDVLWYSDMTTGPNGESFIVERRLSEIQSRYGPDHIVTRFIRRASGTILNVVHDVEDQLAHSS